MAQLKFLAYDLRFGRPVMQASTLETFNMLIQEGGYPEAMLIRIESAEMTAWNWDMQRVETGARIYAINRTLQGNG